MVARDDAADDTFNLVVAAEEYANVKVKVPKVDVFMSTDNNGLGRAQARCRLVLSLPSGDVVMAETSVSNNNSMSATLSGEYVIPAYHIGDKIRAYLQFDFDNTRGSNLGSMDVILTVNNMSVIVSTIKTV
jgi:hypothetical protein